MLHRRLLRNNSPTGQRWSIPLATFRAAQRVVDAWPYEAVRAGQHAGHCVDVLPDPAQRRRTTGAWVRQHAVLWRRVVCETWGYFCSCSSKKRYINTYKVHTVRAAGRDCRECPGNGRGRRCWRGGAGARPRRRRRSGRGRRGRGGCHR